MFERNLNLVFGKTAAGKTQFIRQHLYDPGLPVSYSDTKLTLERSLKLNEALELMKVSFRVIWDSSYFGNTGLVLPDKNITMDYKYGSSGEISLIHAIDVALQIAPDTIGYVSYPEESLHPAIQAEFGSFLAKLIQDNPTARYVIESHSELMLLRLLRLIREKQFDRQKLAVYLVFEGEVYLMEIDEEGEFLERWPGGFFNERMSELL